MEPNTFRWNDAVAAVRRGDSEAAASLVEALYPVVIRIVRGHRHKTDDEEDLAQDIFMKVFSKIDQFNATQPFDHWVSRIALNHCYDKLRRHRIRKVVTYSELAVEEAEFLDRSLGETPVEESAAPAHGEPASELIGKLLETLKPNEQKAIRLLDLEEHSVKEVCALTGWGASKVKVTAMRARRKLAEALKTLEAEGAAANA
ncbi:MAG: RNA polymerase sigma factor [Verrucomicrobiota bacterium]